MGSISSPDPTTTPLKPGMQRLVLHSASSSMDMHSLPMGATSAPDPETTPPLCGMNSHMVPSNHVLVTQSILSFVQSPTWMVGSETQKVAYYTGYPQTFVQACTHLLA